jgi:hypothetical protein
MNAAAAMSRRIAQWGAELAERKRQHADNPENTTLKSET